jgi:hypothetical protein
MANITASIKETEWTFVKWSYICKEKDQKDYLVFVAVTSVYIKDCSFLLAESLKSGVVWC